MIRQQMNGHSGCEVWREGDVVYKRCAPHYAERLAKQVELAERYRGEFGDSVFVPSMRLQEPTLVCMEYIPWLGWLEFVERADYAVMGIAIDRVCALARMELLHAETVEMRASAWWARLEGVNARLPLQSNYLDYASALGRLIQSKPTWDCLSGMCHGDLTCSNLLFNPHTGAIAAVDFLDSFPLTPLWDVAKLKQDAWFHWTLTNAPAPYQNTLKALFCDAWLGRRMNEELQPALSLPLFKVVEALNYLRIVPYARTDAVHNLLHAALDDTLTGEM